MKSLWARYEAWFAALKERERKIVAFAAVGGVLLLGYTWLVEPNLVQARRDAQAIAAAEANKATLTQQADVFRHAKADIDAPLRKELDQLRAQLEEQAQQFATVERSLVSAEAMPALLESMLGQGNGLQLLALKSLPAEPVAKAKAKEAKDGDKAEAEAGKMLFKHGIEIVLAGRYADLVGYLRALENAPQKLLWGRMELLALEYPRSQLTLTVYTLSWDRTWLTL